MKKFPILNVPDVVFREITSTMTPIEIIKLSMSDFKMELFLRSWKYKIRAIHFKLGSINPRIHINTTNKWPSVKFEKTENDKEKPVAQLVKLRNRYQKENEEELCLTHVSLEEMFSIYSNLTRVFSSPEINWILLFDELEIAVFWEYTEKILKTDFHRFTVRGGNMSNDMLTKLMEKMPEKAEFLIDSDTPSVYSHDKALKFRSFKYKEARWLKIEDLFNIRNIYFVELERTNFDCSDVNRFLHYWSNCDKDMMEQITVTWKEGTQVDLQEIFKNLTVIFDSTYRFFIKARNMRHRKRVVGKLEFIGTKIRFSAWDPFKEDCLYEYLVLKLVHQIRDCEARIREKELRGMCTAERMNFQLVLGELERKLTILNRDFFF